jgi:phage terminase large subunit GpA-like protein
MVRLLDDGELLVDEVFKDVFRFPPELTIDIWADQNRILSTKEASIAGRWKTSRTPYLREIMQCLSPSDPCQRVVLMGGTQVGKTEILVNSNGFAIDQDPCPVMNVFPNGTLAGDFSTQRLSSATENTPCLREKISEPRKRDSGNTIMRKEFPGGIIFIVTGNSEISLISRPIKKVNIDEADQYPGWTIPRAEERTTTFEPHCKIYIVGSPRKKSTSVLTNEYSLSDQRKYFIACPECETYQILVWENIKFDRDEHWNLASEVGYACIGCGTHIPEYKMKANMEERAEWRPQNKENGLFPGFHLPQFYSTLGDQLWERAVKKFLKWKKLKEEKNPMYVETKASWENDVLAEASEDEFGEATDWEVLYNRREDYSSENINKNILAIFMGVDVQGDRIEAQIIGVGLNYQIWVIEYMHFYGQITDPVIWANFDQCRLKTYNHPSGTMRILATGIDAGYKTDEVCEYVRTRQSSNSQHVYALKGSSLYYQPIASAPSKNKGIHLFSVGTDTAKDKINLFLKVPEPGPCYIHFPLTLPEEYFQQLCVEQKSKEWCPKERKYKDKWKNPNKARNEALDTLVYAIATLNIVRFLHFPNNDIQELLEYFARQVESPEKVRPASGGRMINEGERIE